jgi:hypothetical protein
LLAIGLAMLWRKEREHGPGHREHREAPEVSEVVDSLDLRRRGA